jgi:lipopolysaccharide transport system permease protein
VLLNVTRNDLRARYAGSFLGVAWVFIAPLVLLAVYAAVYILILNVRVPSLTPLQYVLFIFAGLVPFMMNAEAVSAGVSSVLANVAVLNNNVFPIDLVPPKAVLLSQGVMVTGTCVLLVGALAAGLLSWAVVLLPFIWVLHVIALIGLVWLLSLLNVLFRDLAHAVTLITATLYVISPIAYTREMVPAALAPIVLLNPLAYYLMSYQDVLVRGEIPAVSQLVVMSLISASLFGLGGWFFFRVKRVIVDYL